VEGGAQSQNLGNREEEKEEPESKGDVNKTSAKPSHRKENSSQSSIPKSHNKVDSMTSDDPTKLVAGSNNDIPPARNSEGGQSFSNVAAAMIGVQKAKINLLEKARGRSTSTAKQPDNREPSPGQKNGAESNLSRKASVISNGSHNELALKKDISVTSQPPSSTTNKNAPSNVFSSASLHVNNSHELILPFQAYSDKSSDFSKKYFSKPTGLSASTDSNYIKNLTTLAGLSLLPKHEPSGGDKVRSSNIKVVARFRPLNKMEQVNVLKYKL